MGNLKLKQETHTHGHLIDLLGFGTEMKRPKTKQKTFRLLETSFMVCSLRGSLKNMSHGFFAHTGGSHRGSLQHPFGHCQGSLFLCFSVFTESMIGRRRTVCRRITGFGDFSR